METVTIIIIVGVLMFINLLLNNKRINDLRSLTRKMKEYAIKDFDHLYHDTRKIRKDISLRRSFERSFRMYRQTKEIGFLNVLCNHENL